MSQEVFIYLDDSGTLHLNSKGQYFVYAGYIFLSKKNKDYALAKYRAAVRKINPNPTKELKAYGTPAKTKRFLVSALKDCESLSCVVDKNRVYACIMREKNSIHRFKDYCLKRAIKAKIINLINRKMIDPAEPITIRLFIDNQHTSTDGLYNLRESIKEEFSAGIANFDYGTYHEPIFKNRVIVTTKFCDSKKSYLVQASDLLANSIFIKYNYRQDLKTKQDKHTEIYLP